MNRVLPIFNEAIDLKFARRIPLLIFLKSSSQKTCNCDFIHARYSIDSEKNTKRERRFVEMRKFIGKMEFQVKIR